MSRSIISGGAPHPRAPHIAVHCRAVGLLAGLLAAGLAAAPAAWAQSSPEAPDDAGQRGEDGDPLDGLGEGDRPWAEGVSLEDQEEARRIFAEANQLLMQQYFKEAAAKYREALEHWDHPAIYYNMSLAQMNLEQPLELYYSLGKALEYGVPPLLEEANYRRVENYRNLVGQQLAHVEIVCDEPDAKVTMDGKLLFVAPGSHKGVTLAGAHTIVATKDGFLPANEQVVLSAAKHVRFDLELFTISDLTDQQRRFPKWLPWTVAAAGVAIAGGGAFLHNTARSNFAGFDDEFDATCAGNGCFDDDIPDLVGQLDTATWQQRAGIAAYFVGGAAITTGLVMVFLNQPKTIRRERPKAKSSPGVAVTPVLGPDLTGVSAAVRF